MFGNYIGDGVKGAQVRDYSEAVQRGVHFHRFIDSYTDTHDEVRASKKLFYATQAKFSGVVLDVLFDHLLAKNWKVHHDSSLGEFVARCYRIVGQRIDSMPTRSARFYGYMYAENILESYGTLDGIRQVFRGMDYRTRFDSNMVNSTEVFASHQAELEDRFGRFFPDLVAACQSWKETN